MSEPNEMHTPEPWILCEVGDKCRHLCPAHDDLSILTVALEYNEFDDEDVTYFGAVYKHADARRIVACVNACAGITNAQLESAPLTARIEELEAELKDSYSAYDMMTKLLKDSHFASGGTSSGKGSSWHDLPERISNLIAELAAERAKRERMREALQDAREWMADGMSSYKWIEAFKVISAALDAEKGE